MKMRKHNANVKSLAVTFFVVSVVMLGAVGITSCNDSTDDIHLISTSTEPAKALYGTMDDENQGTVDGRWEKQVKASAKGYALYTYVQGDSPTAVTTCEIVVNGKVVSKVTAHGNGVAQCLVPDGK